MPRCPVPRSSWSLRHSSEGRQLRGRGMNQTAAAHKIHSAAAPHVQSRCVWQEAAPHTVQLKGRQSSPNAQSAP